MAFDGVTIANIVKELNDTIVGGKINKIAQPEADELILNHKKQQDTVQASHIGQRFPAPDLFYREKQSESPHRPKFLYAAAQACGKRQDHCSDPAGAGACY